MIVMSNKRSIAASKSDPELPSDGGKGDSWS